VPTGKGRAYLNRGGVLDAIFGGWNFSAFSVLQSGRPLIMGTFQNVTGSLETTD